MCCELQRQLLTSDRNSDILDEGAHAAALVPLFDPLLSPRNYALVGVKAELPRPLATYLPNEVKNEA